MITMRAAMCNALPTPFSGRVVRRRSGSKRGGITEAGCKGVFTQRLKRSAMAWTIEGGHVMSQDSHRFWTYE